MNASFTANAYKTQQILTATPAELTLMLYNGAIRFVIESIQAIDEKKIEKAHRANMRAQKIMREFMLTMDMSQEISKVWIQIDEYILHCLIKGNMKKDKAYLEEAKRYLIEYRDAWIQVMKEVNKQKLAEIKPNNNYV